MAGQIHFIFNIFKIVPQRAQNSLICDYIYILMGISILGIDILKQ